MDYDTSSEAIVAFAQNISLLVVGLTSTVLLLVVFFRGLLVIRQRRHKAFLNEWRPILYQTLFAVPDKLPALKKRHIRNFIDEWNKLHFDVKGICARRLNLLARQVDLRKHLIKMLRSRRAGEQLTAIIALGYLRDYSSRTTLLEIARGNKPIPSLAATRALLQIDPLSSIEQLIPLIINRKDWPLALVAKVLIEAKNDKLCEVLADATVNAEPATLPRMLQLLDAINCTQATDVYRKILSKEQDGKVIALCLQAIKNPAGLDLVRRYLSHERWHVRVHAATALGRMGTDEDIVFLIKLLSDEQWWVRYRSAQALSAMPFLDTAFLLSLRNQMQDRYAKDVLAHVLAEKQVLVT